MSDMFRTDFDAIEARWAKVKSAFKQHRKSFAFKILSALRIGNVNHVEKMVSIMLLDMEWLLDHLDEAYGDIKWFEDEFKQLKADSKTIRSELDELVSSIVLARYECDGSNCDGRWDESVPKVSCICSEIISRHCPVHNR